METWKGCTQSRLILQVVTALKGSPLPPSPRPDAIATFLQFPLATFTPLSMPNVNQPLIHSPKWMQRTLEWAQGKFFNF